MTKLTNAPGGSLPETFVDESELEGTYRLLSNDRVSAEALLAPHRGQTIARAKAAKTRVYALHDTSEMKFGGEYERDGLGLLPNGTQGFQAHVSLLATHSAHGAEPLGVANLETVFPSHTRKVAHGDRTGAAKRWGQGILAVDEALGSGSVTHVADRESDSFPLMAEINGRGSHFVFRSKWDRNAWDAEGDAVKLQTHVRAEAAFSFERTVTLSARHPGEKRDATSRTGKKPLRGAAYTRTLVSKGVHPPRAARPASLKVAASSCILRRPNDWRRGEAATTKDCPAELALNVVRVFEPTPPEGCDAVEWILLTNLEVDTAEKVANVVDAYRARWLIEEYFKALKSGCKYQQLQLESRHALLNALSLYLSVAWRLLRLRTLARQDEPRTGAELLTNVQVAILRKAVPKAKLPPEPSARDLLLAVAAMGGHIKNNGDPGWQVIARGFDKLLVREAGYFDAVGLTEQM